MKITKKDLKEMIFESVIDYLNETRGLKSSKLYSDMKSHGGIKRPFSMTDGDPTVYYGNYQSLTDEDYIGICDCGRFGPSESELYDLAQKRGIQFSKFDDIFWGKFKDGTYFGYIVRGRNRGGYNRGGEDYQKTPFAQKLRERRKNRPYKTNDYYRSTTEFGDAVADARFKLRAFPKDYDKSHWSGQDRRSELMQRVRSKK